MADVLTQPATRPSVPSASKETLVRSLDDVLEHYLTLLDQHQRLQQNLTKHFSEGFISLAQANFTSPNRTRYGQDFYDDRMQASTHILSDTSKPYFAIAEKISSSPEKPLDKQPQSKPEAKLPIDDPNERKNPPSDSKLTKAHNDPLNWFGILVPPALRSAQSQFGAAVTDEVAQLASVGREMMEAEAEVRKLRGGIKDSL